MIGSSMAFARETVTRVTRSQSSAILKSGPAVKHLMWTLLLDQNLSLLLSSLSSLLKSYITQIFVAKEWTRASAAMTVPVICLGRLMI